jgi:hypothetical protein
MKIFLFLSLAITIPSITHAQNTSHPELGNAYQDPSGLIWGDIVVFAGGNSLMTGAVANQYCVDRQATLPTLQQFEQLMTYLGYGSSKGYSPYTQEGSAEVLPGLVGHRIWSSTLYDWRTAWVFLGGNQGGLGLGYFDVENASARCVTTLLVGSTKF